MNDPFEAEVSVGSAVSIVLLASVCGYVFGLLFTVHLIVSLAEAVWTTTVLFAVIGLSLWGAHRS